MSGSKEVFLRWEKWRIGYNLILLVEGLWLFREHLVALFTRYLPLIVLFAFAANVCYCLGPLLEICVRTLCGSRADRPRYQSFLAGLGYFLFGVGLVFSMWWVWMWSLRGVPKFEDAQRRDARTGIRKLMEGVEDFHSTVGRYPSTAEGLQALVECPQDVSPKVWHGPYTVSGRNGSRVHLRLRPDPWGQEYRYTYTPQGPDGPIYQISSAGKDGTFGTKDDIAYMGGSSS